MLHLLRTRGREKEAEASKRRRKRRSEYGKQVRERRTAVPWGTGLVARLY